MTAIEVLGKRLGRSLASPTTAMVDAVQRSRDRRDGAWIIRALNATLLPDTEWGDCGNPIGPRVAIKRLADERGTMQPATIATCKSQWVCLSCGAKIRAHRATEIDQLAKAHLAAGGGLTFITLTFPHRMADTLAESLAVANKGWRSLISGAGYKGKKNDDGAYVGGAVERWGIIGNIRSIEITDGLTHGWHPHLHVLCFHERPLSPEDGSLQEFRAFWSDRWARWVKRTLGRDIHTERGVDAVPVRDNDGLGEYVSKIHFELVRSDLKRGRRRSSRTPWQIAIDAADTGDCRDMARWVEYCHATKGKWVVTGLPALRRIYAIDAEDLTDDEAATQEQDGTLTVFVDGRLWRAARRVKRRPVIAQALTALETGGVAAMAAVLATVDRLRRITWRRNDDGIPIIEWEGR